VVHIQEILELMLKICIVTQSYYPKPGGVTEVVYHSATELRKRGHHVTVVTTRYGANEGWEDGVIRIGRNMLVPANGAWSNVTAGFGLKRKLGEIFRRTGYDIIQTHCPLVPTLPLLTLEAAGRGDTVVGTFHAAASSNPAYRMFRRPLLKRAQRLDGRIAVSEYAMRFTSSYFPGEYSIVPNGIDCTRFYPDVPPIEELKDDRLNILYVGRMDRRKGFGFLVKALPAAQRALGRKIRLILVGDGKLRRIMSSSMLNINNIEVFSAGRVSPESIPRYYSSADIFCSPATGRESFGIVLLEAMASGVPVIASDIPGYRAVVAHMRDGILVPPCDADSMAESIIHLGGDPSLRHELGMHGREKALTYNWPVVAGMLENVFLRTLGISSDSKAENQITHTVTG